MPEHTPAPTPARSLYGFFMYLFSKTVLVLYCIWAFIPDYCFHYWNISYYPDKYWSTSIPILCLVALTIFALVIYPSSNLVLSTNINSINTLTDPFSHFESEKIVKEENISKCICPNKPKCMRNNSMTLQETNRNTVPDLHDLNIRYVCRKLYL